jgi:hypothetical protein
MHWLQEFRQAWISICKCVIKDQSDSLLKILACKKGLFNILMVCEIHNFFKESIKYQLLFFLLIIIIDHGGVHKRAHRCFVFPDENIAMHW